MKESWVRILLFDPPLLGRVTAYDAQRFAFPYVVRYPDTPFARINHFAESELVWVEPSDAEVAEWLVACLS